MNGGKVSLTIQWPQRGTSRYIPPYANSLAFTLYATNDQGPNVNMIVNRPDSTNLVQTVTFNGPLAPGAYSLTGLAFTKLNGDGDVVAKATSTLTVQPTGNTTVPLSLATTLYSLQIQGVPLNLPLGHQQNLSVLVLDKNKVQVFLPTGALSWSMVFGGNFVSVDANGTVKANALGSARVRVSEIGAGLYSDGDITAVPASGVATKSAIAKPTVKKTARVKPSKVWK